MNTENLVQHSTKQYERGKTALSDIHVARGDDILQAVLPRRGTLRATGVDRAMNSQDILIQQVIHYSKILRIGGLGAVLIQQLVEKNHVTNLFDLYKLTPEHLLECVNVGAKTANRVYTNIQNTRTAEFQDWLLACGIPGIGRGLVKYLIKIIQNIHELADLSDATIQKVAVKLGDVRAHRLKCWVNQNRQWIIHFQEFPFTSPCLPQEGKQGQGLPRGVLFGLRFVFNGQLKNFTRTQAVKQITVLGATVQQRLNKNTHYLVVGDLSKFSHSKVEKAQQLGIQILSEEEFLEFINKNKEAKI